MRRAGVFSRSARSATTAGRVNSDRFSSRTATSPIRASSNTAAKSTWSRRPPAGGQSSSGVPVGSPTNGSFTQPFFPASNSTIRRSPKSTAAGGCSGPDETLGVRLGTPSTSCARHRSSDRGWRSTSVQPVSTCARHDRAADCSGTAAVGIDRFKILRKGMVVASPSSGSICATVARRARPSCAGSDRPPRFMGFTPGTEPATNAESSRRWTSWARDMLPTIRCRSSVKDSRTPERFARTRPRRAPPTSG